MWRKSFCEQNIYGCQGNGDCSKRKLLPDERSVWDDYLDMAALSPVKGQVGITATDGYTLKQLVSILRTTEEVIKRANKHMEALQMITIENSGVIIINNWKTYQSDYDRQAVYREGLHQKVTTQGYKVERKKEVIYNNKYIRKDLKSVYTKILEYWNSKGLIRHKYLNDEVYGRINSKIDHGFTLDEILRAIDNYDHIIKGKQYFWTYRWTLGDFLVRGLDKFMDLEVAKANYMNKDKHYLDEEIAADKQRLRKLAKEE